jgi:hypothetical protein
MAEAQPKEATVVEKKGRGQRGEDLKEVYEKFMVKSCKEFVEFKRLFYPKASNNKDETRDRMERSFRFFELRYGDEDKKRFNMIRTSVLNRMAKELCVVCKQPRKEMILPCQFFKADCGHFIDGNCKDKKLDV